MTVSVVRSSVRRMASPQTTEHLKTRDSSSRHELSRSEASAADRTPTSAGPDPFSPLKASASLRKLDGGTAPDGCPATTDIPGLAGSGAGRGQHGGLRERIRYRRDFRTVEAFGIARTEVETLDGKSLHQLAAWVGVPSIWLAMFFAYGFSAEVVLLVVGIGHQAGWWGQAGWLTITAGAFLAWAFLAQPLLIGLSVLENRLDTSQDPFLPFGRSGSQAIRALTMTHRPQLRRRTLALACLREWHAEGERLGLDVEERFQHATAKLGTTRPITEIAAEVHAQVVPLLVTTVHGTFDADKFPERKRSRLPRPDLIGKAQWFLGAPVVVALVQIIAEYLM